MSHTAKWHDRGMGDNKLYHTLRSSPKIGFRGNLNHIVTQCHLPSKAEFGATLLKFTQTKRKHTETRSARFRLFLARITARNKPALKFFLGEVTCGMQGILLSTLILLTKIISIYACIPSI
jgi:hypothetical protein